MTTTQTSRVDERHLPPRPWPIASVNYGHPSDATLALLADLAATTTADGDSDWTWFLAILRDAAHLNDGWVDPNQVREQLRALGITPQRVSAFYGRAKRERYLGRRPRVGYSSDLRSRNRGKPIRLYRYQEPRP